MKPKIAALVFLPLLASSCGWLSSAKPPEEPAEIKPDAPKLIGRIASVPADKRFVLIQSYETWNVESGTILTTRGLEDRTANLRVTGEKLGQFAAADLQAGSVEVGDAVYSRHVPKPAETPQEDPLSTDPAPSPSPELPTELPDSQQEGNF